MSLSENFDYFHNYAFESGTIIKEPDSNLSVTLNGELLVPCMIKVNRKDSFTFDMIKVYMPMGAAVKHWNNLHKGAKFTFEGQIANRNTYSDNPITGDLKRHLHLFVLARKLYKGESFLSSGVQNHIEIDGSIATVPTTRQSIYRGINISDALVAVSNENTESYFIPTVFWNEDATAIEGQQGLKASLEGFFASRKYPKDGKIHTAYEFNCLKSRFFK